MNEEFEKFQEQIKELESKKISRQKNQTTPKYKSVLRQRREYDEQIMVLKEQKEIISSDRFNISELKAKYESEFIKQLKKIEDEKDKVSKRTYQRRKKNVTDRYNAKMKALEGLNEELLQSDKEEMKANFDAQIEQIRKQRAENEEKLADLKTENEKRNLEIDRAIYYINKTQLKRIDEEISKTSGEIEVLSNSMSQEKDNEVAIAKLKEISKKQAAIEQYQAQKDEFVKRNEKFTKETLEKIAEIKPELKPEMKIKPETDKEQREEKQDIKLKNEADVRNHKLDIGREVMRTLRRNDFKEAGGKIEDSPKKSAQADTKKGKKKNEYIPDEIKVILVSEPFPYLKYSTLSKDGKETRGDGYYSMKKSKATYMQMTYDYKEISEDVYNTTGLDSNVLKKVDPFLLDYLYNTNSDLFDQVVEELREGKGLDSLKEIVHYDMRSADGLRRKDKKAFNKRIVENAENNGFEVKGHEKFKTMLSRMIEKITHKKAKEPEMLESPRQEDRVEKYKKQFGYKGSRKTPSIPMTIADPMKYVKKDQKEKSIDE